MVAEHKTLDETNAGQEVQDAIIREREKFTKELREVQEQMEEALKLRDEASLKAIKEIRDENLANLQRLEQDKENLRINMEKLHNQRYDELRRKLEPHTSGPDTPSSPPLQHQPLPRGHKTHRRATDPRFPLPSFLNQPQASGTKEQPQGPGLMSSRWDFDITNDCLQGSYFLSMNGGEFFFKGPQSNIWWVIQ